MINKLKNTPITETKKPYVLSRAFDFHFFNQFIGIFSIFWGFFVGA